MEPPVMGAVEWQAQVQHIVQGGQGTYGTCGQQTTVQMGACCAGNPGANHAWLGPELQTPQAMYYSPGPGMGMGSMEVMLISLSTKTETIRAGVAKCTLSLVINRAGIRSSGV